MNQTLLTVLAVVLGILIALVLAAPKLRQVLGPKLTQLAGDAYQKRLLKQVKKKYPLIAERIEGFQMGPETQQTFESTMRKLPPQEAMKLQAEFNRLRDKFVERHPEIAPFMAAGQDAQAQAKAIDALFKLPDAQRTALEKDLLWAWDQLRGRFPKLMGQAESAFRKKDAPTK